MKVAKQSLEEDGYNKFMKFDYPVTKYELDTIQELKNYASTEQELNKEICMRITYTLHDPFYE